MGPVTFLLLSPLAAACILFFIPKTHLTALKTVALAGTAASLLFAVHLFTGYRAAGPDFQFVDKIDWIPALGISYHVGIDGANAILLLLTAFCAFAGVTQ